MSKLRDVLVKKGELNARRVHLGQAILRTERYAADLRREQMVNYIVGGYSDEIRRLQAEGQADADKRQAENTRRRDLRSEALNDDVAASFKGVSEAAVTAWKQHTAGMSVEELAAAYRNARNDWQRYVIEMSPRTETTLIMGQEVTTTATGWSDIERLAKEREAQLLDIHARMAGLPEGSLSSDILDRDSIEIQADVAGLEEIDAIGYEHKIRGEFKLGDEPDPVIKDFEPWEVHRLCNELERIEPVIPSG